jgi:hypothetical protein
VLEHGDVAGAKAPPLRDQPAVEMRAAIDRFNRSGDASMVVPSEYLEIVITRR